MVTEQVETGDLVTVGFDSEQNKLIFTKQSGKMIVSDYDGDILDDEPEIKTDAVGLPLPQARGFSEKSKSTSEHQEV